MSKSVHKHFYGDASSSACAQVDSNWTEDGAHGEGTMLACFLIRNAAQVPKTAAQRVVLVFICSY